MVSRAFADGGGQVVDADRPPPNLSMTADSSGLWSMMSRPARSTSSMTRAASATARDPAVGLTSA